ncbi:MAG: electron transport complex subunit E [Clostridiales bacterium]|nr:electron transport complex subunit E [Clostridiales bacterium]
MTKLQNFLKGLLRENPVLVLVLGTCPTLAMSKSMSSALGMGLAATAVLICSNAAISALRKVIPDKVRIPCYIVLIAGFVTVVQLLMQALLPELYTALGTFLALIVVNCIILGRAEMYASKNGVVDSIIDGAGMGLGFTLALLCMATVREILGSGSWFGLKIPVLCDNPIGFFAQTPGGFVVFGIMIALVNFITKGKLIKKKEFGCEGCPSAAICQKAVCEKAEAEKVAAAEQAASEPAEQEVTNA